MQKGGLAQRMYDLRRTRRYQKKGKSAILVRTHKKSDPFSDAFFLLISHNKGIHKRLLRHGALDSFPARLQAD
jgi:hypothetical protein